jgi:hypothetical protein
MRSVKSLRGICTAVCLAISLLLVMMAGEAMAATLNVCVPEEEGVTVQTPLSSGCKAKYNESRLLPKAEAEKLEKILPYMKYEEKGIDGKPTIQFSGVNVQIVNGEGKTATTNGEGNLVIGYDEDPEKHAQTGSHDLILGEEQMFTSYGSIIAGYLSSATEPFSSVTGGEGNKASGKYSSVGGGHENTASGEASSFTGGVKSKAEAYAAAVSGGASNTASGRYSAVSGGNQVTAHGEWAWGAGGEQSEAFGSRSCVVGGHSNKAEANYSCVFAGNMLTATKEYEGDL